MNAVCDHDVSDVERNVMVTCTCVDDWLFWHGLPVLATMCDSRGVWMTDTLDCLGKTRVCGVWMTDTLDCLGKTVSAAYG